MTSQAIHLGVAEPIQVELADVEALVGQQFLRSQLDVLEIGNNNNNLVRYDTNALFFL